VRFHFREVYGKQLLEANEGLILPKHAWSALPLSEWRRNSDWFREHLVTSGPFVLASWTPQQEMVLERNPRFYEPGLPYLDRIVIRIVPEQATMLTRLRNGELDFVSGLSPEDVPAIRADPDLQLIAYPFRLFVVIAWNGDDPRFASPAVRRALAMAIDRQALVDALWGEFARVGASPIVYGVWARNPAVEPLPYDPAAARRVLAEHGWRDGDGDGLLDKDGKPFRFELATNTGNRQRADALVIIQEQLRRIGVEVEPRVVEFHTLMDQLDQGSFAATIAGLGMDTSLDLTSVFHSRAIAEGNNFARYRNPEVDRLIERVLRYPEIAAARADLYRIQQIVHDEQPLSYLWESQRMNAANARLRNVQSNIMYSLFDPEEWWMAKQ
jgi:peptide/nickel transport system substrate-binding protein